MAEGFLSLFPILLQSAEDLTSGIKKIQLPVVKITQDFQLAEDRIFQWKMIDMLLVTINATWAAYKKADLKSAASASNCTKHYSYFDFLRFLPEMELKQCSWNSVLHKAVWAVVSVCTFGHLNLKQGFC